MMAYIHDTIAQRMKWDEGGWGWKGVGGWEVGGEMAHFAVNVFESPLIVLM